MKKCSIVSFFSHDFFFPPLQAIDKHNLQMYICLAVKQYSNEAFARISLQVLQWPRHGTFGIMSDMFIFDYIYDSWTLVIQICAPRRITNTHALKQRSAVDTVLHVLSEINISFALLLCLDADWHPFLRGQLRDMHTHTYALSHTQHTLLACSGPLFALTDVAAVLSWHLADTLSLLDAHHCLPTTLSNNKKTPHVLLRACLCVALRMCFLIASGLWSLLHSTLISLLHQCLRI